MFNCTMYPFTKTAKIGREMRLNNLGEGREEGQLMFTQIITDRRAEEAILRNPSKQKKDYLGIFSNMKYSTLHCSVYCSVLQCINCVLHCTEHLSNNTTVNSEIIIY